MSYLEKLLGGAEATWMPLAEVGQLVRGNGLQKKDFTETGVPAIHYGQIYTHYGLSTAETKSFVSPELARTLRKVDSGDVVITNTSENLEDVGKALVYLGKQQAVIWGWRAVIKAAMYLTTDNALAQAGLLLGPENIVRLEPPVETSHIEMDDWASSVATFPPLAESHFLLNKVDIARFFEAEVKTREKFYS